MILHTDEQTIEDLRIFGKRDNTGIYDLYNNTHTRGGEKVLEEMFRNPLADRLAINRRAGIIGNLSRLQLSFPFNASLFDMAEKYLSIVDAQSKSGNQQTLSDKDIQNGVSAVIELMQETRQFIGKPAIAAIDEWAMERKGIELLLTDPAFEPVFNEQPKGKLPYSAISAYDLLFRTRERNKIEKLLGYIYYLDVYLTLKGVYHPELKHPVPNDVEMDANNNLVFLTGANMAGKSTFLRSLSTAVYIAHMGFPVAATDMEFSVMDGIYTTINLPDNLGIGASHFYAEVLRVKKVAAALGTGKSLFIIFDELFRGTNVKDAHEATVAITRSFAGKSNSLFIISSHIVEAGEQLQQSPTIEFRFLPTRMNGHTPEYTYTLETGITEDRHGMIIIRNEGILEILKKGRKRAV
jgi:DNA mismatch repair ATPase MutS